MRKPDLLIGCAAGALLAAAAAPAAAQSFQGTPTVVTGAANVTTAPNTTIVQVFTPETVINWAAEDTAASGAIDFQPFGTTATFETTPAITDYTVLNRILPVDGVGSPVTASVSFNGTVNSLIINDPGGHIWFYSPDAIIVGPTGRFNVGSLILTTNDIAYVPNPAGGFGSIYGPGGLVDINGPAGSTGYVQIDSGAQLNATGANAYVALIAPRVVQRGLVQADGQVAYIAAEQLDLTINGGLFDFVITVGTTDPEGIVHSGTTTGPASTGVADAQRIAMVALPKNDALTMMLAGSIGYSPAASAANEGSSVVLAAGFARAAPTADPGNRLGSIAINGASTFANRLTGFASDAVTIAPAVGSVDFAAVSTFHALNDISVIAGFENQINAATDLVLNAGTPGFGGDVLIDAHDGGLIDVTRQLSASARPDAFYGPAPGDAIAGTITITADDGQIHALEAFVEASADGGFSAALGGAATGGTIDVDVRNGGSFTVDNFASFNASATGGDSTNTGGSGLAGTVTLTGDAGALTLGSLIANANGIGGSGDAQGADGTGGAVTLAAVDGSFEFGTVSLAATGRGGASAVQAGDGFGGQVDISIATGSDEWDELFVDADASAGGQLVSGTGRWGSAAAHPDAIRLEVAGSTDLTIAGELELTANAFAGIDGAPGFSGQAGGIVIDVGSGSSLPVTGSIFAHADALVDSDVTDFSPISSATQTGGTVSITVDGGSLSADRLDGGAHAYGLSGSTAAGTATGGTVTLSALNGGAVTLDNGVAGEASAILWANGYGSPGPIAGDAFGGTVNLFAVGGTISVNGPLELSASGLMSPFAVLPADGEGFDATGGFVTIEQTPAVIGTPSITSSTLLAGALGDARVILDGGSSPPGGEAVLGDGGTGIGGEIRLRLAAGDLLGFSLVLDSSGFGGASAATGGATAFRSGDGAGGLSEMAQSGGTSSYFAIGVLSDGVGGGGGPAAAGAEQAAFAGDGTGGNAVLAMVDSTTDTFATLLSARGIGADGMDHAGAGDATDGGAGMGGVVLLVNSPVAGTFNSPSGLTMTANGIGGTGGLAAGASLDPPTGVNGNGGGGFGGSALADLVDGTFSLGFAAIEAIGTGGDSGDAATGIPGAVGGVGIGGQSRFTLIDTGLGPIGARSIGDLVISSSGVGGSGATFVGESGAGGSQLTVSVLDGASALDVTGGLVIDSTGCCQTATLGIQVLTSGAPLEVGGDITMTAAGPLAIDAVEPLRAGGVVFLDGNIFNSTGLIQSGGSMIVNSTFSLTAERLTSGDFTWLTAFNGSLIVADLNSVGPVMALGQSVDIGSLGALSFDDLDATGGVARVATAGDLALTTADATGAIDLSSTGGSIAATGAVVAGGPVSAIGSGGVSFTTLTSGGTTLLQSPNGAIAVTALTSPGPVTAQGRSVDLDSPGALSFADARATAGAVTIDTQGNLALAQGSASGGLFLTSANGTVTGTGPLSAGNNASVIAPLGVTLASLAVGGTTQLRATGGPVDIDSLTSGGLVTALGRTVDIASPGALSFADLDATAGPLTVVTAGNLALSAADATDALTLRSTAGSITATGAINSGGNATVDGQAGVFLPSLDSGGLTQLASTGGNVDIELLTSAGAVSVAGVNVDLDGSGPLTFTAAQADLGMSIVTSGDLSFASVGAGIVLDLASTGGSLFVSGDVVSGATGLQAAGDIAIDGNLTASGQLAAIAGGSMTVLGEARVDSAGIVADGGISFGLLDSGGTTTLLAANGPLAVSDLLSAGEVIASAQSIDIVSSGALTFADLVSASGPLSVQTAGNLAVASIDAPDALTLRSTGGSVTASSTIDAGGDALIEGHTGVTFPFLDSGGTTQLASDAGDVEVSLLFSAGPVTVAGNNVDIVGSGALTFASAEAVDTMSILAANLAFASVSAGGNLDLTATGGSLTATGDVSGGATILGAFSDIAIDGDFTTAGPLSAVAAGRMTVLGNTSAASANISASDGISLAGVASAGTTSLVAALGPLEVTDLISAGPVAASARTIDIASTGALTFTALDATSGNLSVQTAGNLVAANATASGWLNLGTSAGDIVSGNLTAGSWLHADSAGGAALGNLTAAIDAAATARGGTLSVGNVTAGDEIWLSVFGTDPASQLTAGNLLSTGLGSDTAAGPPVLFGGYPGGAGPTGNVIRVRSAGSLGIGDVTTPDRAILVADLGTTGAGALSADEALILLGRGDIALASATTGGSFYVADSAMFALLPDAYDPASLVGADPVRTGGGLSAAGPIQAGSVTLAIGDDATLPAVNSGGATLLGAGGTIDIASLTSAGTVSAEAGDSLFIDGSGPLTFSTAEALNDLAIRTSGDLALGSVDAGIHLDLASTGGSLTATGDVLGVYTDLAAADEVLIGGRLAGSGRLVVNTGGAFTTVGETTAGDANITAEGNIAMPALHAGEAISLIANNGTIVLPELTGGVVVARGLDVDIRSSGSLSFFEVSATSGDLTIRTAGTLRASRLFASDAIDLDSGGTFVLNGEARAATIDVVSSDIEIDDEVGQLGVRGVTSTITLLNGDSESDTFIGGELQGDGDYSLDRGEAARLFADGSITLLASDDITVGDLALSFGSSGNNIGTGGRLEISTPDEVHVTGEVMLRTASADDTFVIDPRLIELDTDTGSITMFTGEGGGGTAQGRLELIGDTVAVATGSVLGQLDTLTDFEAIRDALDQPGGTPQPLRAGSLLFDAQDGIFIQNTGASDAFADRRGFVTGSIEIVTADPATRIAVNGQILGPSGTVSGLDVIPLVDINDQAAAAGGRFDPASTINGCTIGTNCAALPPPPERPEIPAPPTSEDIAGTIPPNAAVSLFVAPIIELADGDPLVEPPLVDEPITGVGNDDLWEPRCDDDDEACEEADSQP